MPAPHGTSVMRAELQQATLTSYSGGYDGDGLCHGQGHAVFTSGQSYNGHWQHGHIEGTGNMSFSDGVSYEGTFHDNTINGSGVYTWPCARYQGQVVNGLRHGLGTLFSADSPAVYEGEWQMGKRHGSGTLYYNADRTAYYRGDWRDDMKHGQGTSLYPSGNVYSGSWVGDQRQGQGSMQWVTKGQQYSGTWHQGLPEGLGEHIWLQQQPSASQRSPNHAMRIGHNRYVGMFKEGQRHGQGTLYYSSGARYEGQWQRGLKHGAGVYVFEDGSVFSGQFAADRPVLSSGCLTGAVDTLAAAAADTGYTLNSSQLGTQHNKVLNGTSCSREVSLDTAVSGGKVSPGGSAVEGKAEGGLQNSPPPVHDQQRSESGAIPAGRSSNGASAANQGPRQRSPVARQHLQKQTSKAPAAALNNALSASRKQVSSITRTANSSADGLTAENQAGEGLKQEFANNSSSSNVLSFGPAVSVMQLYIADLLQEHSQQPADLYRAVSNLVVEYNTELRLLYDKYSSCPSPLLDADVARHSWAMQACQMWELLRDAGLLCRHVSLPHVCSIVAHSRHPCPPVLQHRLQVLRAASQAAVEAQQPTDVAEHCAIQPDFKPGTVLLFRDFCEVLVRVAAARYPSLPSLDLQLQQVISYHLLALISGAAKPASAARISMMGASSGNSLCTSSAATGSPSALGPEQQLHSPEVVEVLQHHVVLLQQLFVGMTAAREQPLTPATTDLTASASAMTWAQEGACSQICRTALTGVGGIDTGVTLGVGAEGRNQQSQAEPALSPAGPRTSSQHVCSVRQAVAHLLELGAIGNHKLQAEQVAVCLLHSAVAAADPEPARACIDDPNDESSRSQESSTGDMVAAIEGTATAAEVALQNKLLFLMDTPLVLQNLVWGLVRLAALQSASAVLLKDHKMSSQPLQLYLQLFIDKRVDVWDSSLLPQQLQVLLAELSEVVLGQQSCAGVVEHYSSGQPECGTGCLSPGLSVPEIEQLSIYTGESGADKYHQHVG